MKITRLLPLLALLLNLTTAEATIRSTTGETRTAKVTKKIEANAIINVQAKYTDLSIETWEKNEVYIEASIRFDGKMTDKMKSFLATFQQEVESGIESSPNEIRINTNLGEPNKVQIGSKNVGIVFGYSEDELRISYIVKAPKSSLFEIDHSYQDLTINGDIVSLNLKQYSGELNAQSIQRADLNLKYGSAKLTSIGSGEMTLYEQELRVDDIGKVNLNAKYSDLQFEKSEMIIAQAYESDFEIGSVTTMEGNFKYGDISFKNKLIKGQMELYEMDLEGVNIKELRLVNSKYSKFNFEKVESIQFDQSYEDEIDIGTLGKLKSSNSKYAKIKINSLQGDFSIEAYEADINIKSITEDASEFVLNGKYLKARIAQLPENFSILADTKYGKISYNEDLVDIRKYVKESDKLELEAYSKKSGPNPFAIKLTGYEIDADIN